MTLVNGRHSDFPLPTVGSSPPPYSVVLTLQRLIMETAAIRDFAMIHTDVVAARDSGARGPFANTTFIETIFEAMLRSWAGPQAWIESIEFRMTDHLCAGDEVVANARATDIGADGVVVADIWIDGVNGRAVSGEARIRWVR